MEEAWVEVVYENDDVTTASLESEESVPLPPKKTHRNRKSKGKKKKRC
jgi:hypothetical protein